MTEFDHEPCNSNMWSIPINDLDSRRNIDDILQQHLADDARIQNLILEELRVIKEQQASMLGMLDAFNNIKGFAATMRTVALLATWVVVFVGSLTAIGYSIKQWVRS